MKAKTLGLLGVGLMAFASMTTQAAIVTITGSGNTNIDGQWDISTIYGNSTDLVGTLDDQVWWGDFDLARLFVTTLQDGLGYPNGEGYRGPDFAVSLEYAFRWVGDPMFQAAGIHPYVLDPETYAVATKVSTPVPLPAAAWLLLSGLGGLGLLRRRKAA